MESNTSTINRKKRSTSTTRVSDDVICTVLEFLKEVKHDIHSFLGHPGHEFWKKYDKPFEKTADILGISPATVAKCKKRKNDCGNSENIPPRVPLPQQTPIPCDTFTIAEIRRVTLDFYARRIYPTRKLLLEKCLENPNFPRVGLTTFGKFMKKAKFRFTTMNRKPVYLERQDIVLQRSHYLKTIKHYREEGYKIVYVDETWANPDQAPSKCWLFHLEKDEFRQFRDVGSNNKVLIDFQGYTGGWKLNGGAGRIIINHAGSEDGFVPNVGDIFISKKDTKDYHSSMNGEHYINWFKLLVNNVPEKSVVVLDQAPYHRIRVAETVMPKYYWKKQDIVNNLQRRQISITTDSKTRKRDLIALSEEHPVSTKFEVERIAEESGKNIKILWLPVAHCELNPIELIWSYVKMKIGKENKFGGISKTLDITKQVVELVTADLWKSCVRHATDVENQMWERDNLIDNNFFEQLQDPIIINLRSCDDTSSDDDDDCDVSDALIDETVEL